MVAHGVDHHALGLRAAVHHQIPVVAGVVVVEHDGDLGTARGVLRAADDAGLAAGRDELQMELLHPVVRRFQERCAHGAVESGVRVVLLQGLVEARDHVGRNVVQERAAYPLGLAVLHEEGLSQLRGGGPSRGPVRGVVDVALRHEDAWPLAGLGLAHRGAHACEAVGRVELASVLFEAVASHQRHQPPEGGLQVAGRAQVS